MKGNFDSAKSLAEIVKAFKDLESCFDEKYLGFACWKIAYQYDIQKNDSEQVLFFSNRALEIMKKSISGSNSSGGVDSIFSLPIAGNLELLGSACHKLNRLDESVSYFDRAVRMLEKLGEEGAIYRDNIVLHTLVSVHARLFVVKNSMGKRNEGFSYLMKNVELTKKITGEYSLEFAKAKREVSNAYLAEMNFKDAVPYCLKSMGIYTKVYGDNSEEVAESRKMLGLLYSAMGEYGKGLEQNLLSQRVLNNLGCSSLLLRTEIEAASSLIDLGRHEEGIKSLNSVLPKTGELSEDRMLIFKFMAQSSFCQKKFEETKSFAKKVWEIVDKIEKNNPFVAAVQFTQIAKMYENVEEFETALSLLRRVSSLVEKLPVPSRSCSLFHDVSYKIGELLLKTGNTVEAIPYLEEGVKTMKNIFGSKHSDVGYAYWFLGSAYYDANQLESSVEQFGRAKDIMDEILGPNHVNSINIRKNMCRSYAAMGRYAPAINLLEEIIERLEALGSDGQYV